VAREVAAGLQHGVDHLVVADHVLPVGRRLFIRRRIFSRAVFPRELDGPAADAVGGKRARDSARLV